MKLFKKILETNFSFINHPETKNPVIAKYKNTTKDYTKKRKNYHKVDCNIDIAYMMFIQQCVDKAIIDNRDKILNRALRFLPAHLKLQNAIITQQDCLSYLSNEDSNKLVLLDVPYIGYEYTCGINGTRQIFFWMASSNSFVPMPMYLWVTFTLECWSRVLTSSML